MQLPRLRSFPAHHLYSWPDKMPEYTRADYEKLKALTDPNVINKLSLDDLVFARFGYDLYDNPLPPKVDMIGNAHYQGKEFSDCGETSLRNLLNVLCYDNIEKKFDLGILKTLLLGSTNPKLFEFYARYAITAKIKDNQAHDALGGCHFKPPELTTGHTQMITRDLILMRDLAT